MLSELVARGASYTTGGVVRRLLPLSYVDRRYATIPVGNIGHRLEVGLTVKLLVRRSIDSLVDTYSNRLVVLD